MAARARGPASAKVAVTGVTPFLWFKDQALPAAKFYVSTFQNSSITNVSYYPRERPRAPRKVLAVEFVLSGQRVTALNGGPALRPTGAFSFYVDCPNQKSVDVLWERLSRGGKKNQCGWLTDRFGLTWQVIPARLPELLTDPDEEKAGRVMAAMMKMHKIEIEPLERAYSGAS
jgi:predicted 3-demethylubiquinone-9 3-methyltransferase (glyoxalase superfamily)